MPIPSKILEANILRRYAHPLERVYRAWTTVEHIEQWFRPFDDVTLSVEEFDLREGGGYFFRYTWPGGEFPVRGKFLAIRPGQSLIFTWEPREPDVDAGKETMVSVFFRELEPALTEVEVRHTLFPDESMRQRHVEGWNATLDRLSRYLWPELKKQTQPRTSMNNTDTLKKFYAAMESHDWANKRSLMHDDFSFRGPLMQADSADQMLRAIQQMNCSMTFKDMLMAEAGDTVMSFFTCEMTQPAPLSFRCAERVTFKDGRIKASELIYDARAFPSMG